MRLFDVVYFPWTDIIQRFVYGGHQRSEVIYVVRGGDQNYESKVKLFEMLLMLHILVIGKQDIKFESLSFLGRHSSIRIFISQEPVQTIG